MKNFTYTTVDGNETEITTEGTTNCGIEYELKAITDEDDALVDARLDITTPAAFIIVLQNLTDDQVDELVEKLRLEYSYHSGDCVSLKIPGSAYDCIFVNSSVSEEHPLGYNIVEKEFGTVDGHEIEVCDVLTEYISDVRKNYESKDNKESHYVGYSIIYDTEVLPDDECVNIIESCSQVERENENFVTYKVPELELALMGMEDDLLESELVVRRGFSYEDITFRFHHMKEEKRHIATSVAK